jgi:hypothetical protein
VPLGSPGRWATSKNPKSRRAGERTRTADPLFTRRKDYNAATPGTSKVSGGFLRFSLART